MQAEHISRCDCGAVTVVISSQSYSMTRKYFNKLFGRHRIRDRVGSCDYCVNHWGLDLCHCGSGKKVYSCKELGNCGRPMQVLTFGQYKKAVR